MDPSTHSTHARARLNPVVFYSSAAAILLLGTLTVVYPQASQAWLATAQAAVSRMFGWYYMLVMVACMVFVLWLAASRYGSIRLGRDDERPAFGYASWTSMLFSSGIGIALLYYGAYEPLDHFLSPPVGAGGTAHAAREAMAITFLHWGLHGWALYALIATALGYFSYRRGLPLALRSALYPLFGERIHGWIGHLVDGFGILVTLVSMVTNLGIGALLLNSGLHYLFGTPATPQVLVGLVIVMMVVATIAAVTGVEKGIAILSNLNIRLLCLLLLFVLVCGPTLHLFDGMVQNVGDYLTSFIGQSFNLYLYDSASKWLGDWTLFYWAWWIAWAPFVGMFIARISRGRTIRELVIGVLLIPLGFTLAWLSIFGNTAIDLVLNHGAVELGQVAQADPPMALFKLFEYLPGTRIVAGITILIGFVLFLTPVDSGTLMIANLSTRGGTGEEDAPIWLRVFWAVATTVVSIGLLLGGSFNAMQTAVVLCGLPFSVVLLLYMQSLRKALALDHPVEPKP
ncbi:choline/glycine/proline betaine transport protein [Dyella sp. OK004]|uniref:BCCT family transporter n=1 Tax=Dyella sp. OK004 TaxID=1855292 RepID=UPI0008E3D1B3|nr:BCCT family transporter [Dyella sp. OK004]SFR87435.1 choline/glycine/proline betaine transport protein [Dyella sp. OK004]